MVHDGKDIATDRIKLIKELSEEDIESILKKEEKVTMSKRRIKFCFKKKNRLNM